MLGMILEAYGFVILFRFELFFHSHMCSAHIYYFKLLMDILCSGFWPTLPVFLQKIPVLGWVFQQPFVRSVHLSCYSVQSYFEIIFMGFSEGCALPPNLLSSSTHVFIFIFLT